MSEWIKIENGLPEENCEVLVTDGQLIAIGHLWDEGSRTFYGHLFYYENGNCLDEITHWMRLPRAPNE